MGYSEEMFDVVADLARNIDGKSKSDPLRNLEDLIFAVSLDSGLSIDDVRRRLLDKMPTLSRATL